MKTRVNTGCRLPYLFKLVPLCTALGRASTGLGALVLIAIIGATPKEAVAGDISPSVVAADGQLVRTVEGCKQARRRGELDRAGFRECKRTANAARIDGLDRAIARQQQVLAALRRQLSTVGMHLDAQAQVLDEGGRVLAQIVAINGKLILRDKARADVAEAQAARAQNLEEIRAYLEANS